MIKKNLGPKMADKIISIDDLHRRKKIKEEETGLINYYRALDFENLLSEVNTITKKIEHGLLTDSLKRESKMILKEFKSRLDSPPPEWANYFVKMEEEISRHIHR